MVFSSFESCCSTGDSLLVEHSLNGIWDVFADDGGQLVVADVAVKSFEFLMVAVYVPNCGRLSLKGQAEVCTVYIFPLILYWLSVLPLPKDHWLVLIQSLSKLLWSGQKLMVHRQVCCQCPQNGDLGIPDLESHWLAERLAYQGRSLSRDMVW